MFNFSRNITPAIGWFFATLGVTFDVRDLAGILFGGSAGGDSMATGLSHATMSLWEMLTKRGSSNFG